MAFRFLHSADLHLGKPFGGFPDDIRHRLREARHGAIATLAEKARQGGATAILLAGDTFDAETPAPATRQQALRAMADESDLTWYLLPGNHDSLAASELWRLVAADPPGNLRPVLSDSPLELAPGVWLLPAPCTRRRPGRDLTEAMAAPTPEGALRIGLGHGAVTDFSEDGTAGIIPPDRAARAGLHYLALGDWHGQLQVSPETWYAGTPEPDGFRHDAPAAALLVTLEGPAPRVVPVETGRFRWRAPMLALLPGDDPAARLADLLPASRPRDHLLRLTVTGRLPLAGHAALAAAIARAAPDLGWCTADLSALGLDARPDDLDAIDRGGALRQAAEALLAESQDTALPQPDRDTAAAALSRLYSLVQAVQG